MSAPRYLDQALFDDLAGAARSSTRRRHHHAFHQMSEPCHRLAVGLQPDTYIAPHRHLEADKSEGILVLRGRLGLLVFNDAGAVVERRILEAGGECVGVDLPPGTFHAFVVLDADTMMFECKAGPYRAPEGAERPDWAPHEGDPDAHRYLAWMRQQFES
ncbi:WbuC family cupin fold metalloprotein [Stutzerimonas azotifigens]|uniref:Cupin fold metalloprotein, WbuC family n=1 Tax=Stutzerimonas azotifigens TaxID=291995 RepID=A0ABR5Z754_9GAMM|nr:WbuC family cupin fold metalloprotein [Stutzerimonas azotifigens]MBA1276023.1 cupin fold metalloprotein, WbuC family [Stutzerimonas azotifigens]